ncbi:L-histidine N(alpha)-methyltransferase [Gallionella capsiferriformans]|uniref:Methyltransferase n=1 Tax=Gallionella capsiferriformans (strain ES-2) TaxID=395494 RepID=D9SHE6_GALCS|nr:L-histidine N(alpha)-methyltransferase [Gallionella capsiferriformans]ADL55943.1 methyltransferase [Gallionella capsiferriformans ES-2]
MRSESPTPSPDQEKKDFLCSVREGLRSRPKTIPPKYFYDAHGSHLFDLICTTPEYYPTRTETAILEHHSEEMAEMIGTSSTLIELGSGSAIKTPLILRHLSHDAVYVPIDICEPHLRNSTQRLQTRFPALKMQPLCADYHRLPAHAIKHHVGRRKVVFFPGSTIGNCTPDEAVTLLKRVAALVGPGGGLLIGVDAKKSTETLNAAYNDAAGHTAAFNRNLLTRMQSELGAQLDADQFAHHAYYNEPHGRIEMHLVSRCKQAIRLDGESFEFDEGESIHTENSYKYSAQEFKQLARTAGWHLQSNWHDENELFNVHYLSQSAAEPLKLAR